MISDKSSYKALKDRLDTAGKRFYTCLYLYSTKEPTESLSRVFTTPFTWITLKRNLVPRATPSGTPITPSDTGVRARFHYSLSTWSQHRTIRKLLRWRGYASLWSQLSRPLSSMIFLNATDVTAMDIGEGTSCKWDVSSAEKITPQASAKKREKMQLNATTVAAPTPLLIKDAPPTRKPRQCCPLKSPVWRSLRMYATSMEAVVPSEIKYKKSLHSKSKLHTFSEELLF